LYLLPLLGPGSLCGDASTLMKDLAEHVVSDIGGANFHLGSIDPNRPEEELHLKLLLIRDMLNGGPDFRPPSVCQRHRFQHGIALWLALKNIRLQAILFQPLFVTF